MTLPKMNAPRYNTVLPVSGKSVNYRPFFVREQKSVLIASASGTYKDLLVSMAEMVNACTFNTLDSSKIPLLDFEKLFMEVRSKSVSEIAEVTYHCNKCDNEFELSINLEKDLTYPEYPKNTIQITDDIYLTLNYPSLNLLIELGENPDGLESAIALTQSIIEGDTVYEDFTEEEIREFFESLTHEASSKVRDFFDSVKSVFFERALVCPKCGNEDTVRIEGVLDFFV